MIGILREEVFSPNRVEDDAAILRLTAEAVRRRGYDVELIYPHDLSPEIEPRMAFAMCEGLDSLKLLETWESKGFTVVNSPRAVKNCYRHRMLTLLNHGTLPLPKTLLIQTSQSVNGHFNLRKGVWVKRGDVHSTQPGDVELIFDRPSLEKTLESMRSRWVDQAVLQEHLHGDLIKSSPRGGSDTSITSPRKQMASRFPWTRSGKPLSLPRGSWACRFTVATSS
jgi:hypothetical protein